MRRLLLLLLLFCFTVLSFAQTATAPSVGDGSSGAPYEIATLENLYWITQNSTEWNKYFKQTALINAAASSSWDGGSGFTPIGNSSTRFTGDYDGQEFIISNLYINRSATSSIGLFGEANGATIVNVSLGNATVTGQDYVGGMIGRCVSMPCTITNCEISGTVTGGTFVGGLVGYLYGNITGSASACAVYASTQAGGGLVGHTVGAATITDCYSLGNVEGTAIITEKIGGLVGDNEGTISQSYSTGDVSCYDNLTGGFVGYSASSITNCYSTGDVTRYTSSLTGFGAFAGEQDGGSITNCYSIGSVTYDGGADPSDKGFVATETGTPSYSNNFFDYEASIQTTATGATAKTTSEMKDYTTFTAAGWDFVVETANGINNYWDADQEQTVNSGYPILSWQTGADNSLPVELAAFTARCEGQSVIIEWTTACERDNLGFILERLQDNQNTWQVVASYRTCSDLAGQGTTSQQSCYAYTDAQTESGATYAYRLSDVSVNGEQHTYKSVSVETEALPQTTQLDKAYPNPFNPQTRITYHLANATNVEIVVYDMLGRKVRDLYTGKQTAGSYEIDWNGTDKAGNLVPSGAYFVKMNADHRTLVEKVLFIK